MERGWKRTKKQRKYDWKEKKKRYGKEERLRELSQGKDRTEEEKDVEVL